MELKWPICLITYQTETVLIVPLWNWNISNRQALQSRRDVLIVPLWNWNKILWSSFTSLSGSNRTFMELKLLAGMAEAAYSYVLIVPLWNWNWISRSRRNQCLSVLIVPLWNWNKLGYLVTHPSVKCSNRTFMELKYLTSKQIATGQIVLIVPLWNWNYHYRTQVGRTQCSNRTFMELKCACIDDSLFRCSVLIVPLWNWNGDDFKVNMQHFSVLIVPLWNWNFIIKLGLSPASCSNRTFMELKYSKLGGKSSATNCSNRTFMELKFMISSVFILLKAF